MRVEFEGDLRTIMEDMYQFLEAAVQSQPPASDLGVVTEKVAPVSEAPAKKQKPVPEQPNITLEFLTERAMEYGAEQGTDALLAALKKFKAERVREIPEDQWPAFLSHLGS